MRNETKFKETKLKRKNNSVSEKKNNKKCEKIGNRQTDRVNEFNRAYFVLNMIYKTKKTIKALILNFFWHLVGI
jgi:hypothetical protein